jgi:muramidase (phage lysozyme)
MPRITPVQAGGLQVCAFLDVIAVSEIGTELLAVSDDGYDVLVGSTASKPLLFHSYADHPDVFNQALNSDAAGRYQQMYEWWPAYKRQLGLKDFSPLSQDMVALQLMRECHAIVLVQAGQLEEAVFACSSRWASFPGNNYGQHIQSLELLAQAFKASGGIIS